MSELNGQSGEIRFTVEIKRAATGETEVVEMVGNVDEEIINQLKEQDHGSYSHNSGA